MSNVWAIALVAICLMLTHGAAHSATKGQLRKQSRYRKVEDIYLQEPRPLTLIILTYVDPIGNEAEAWRRANLVFFFKRAILPFPEYHYVIVFQGCHEIKVPDLPNVEFFERDNSCFDAGGWLDVIDAMRERKRRFQRYIFMNISVRGPFLPAWAQGTDWVTAFTWPLVNEPKVKLIGTSINCWFVPKAVEKGEPLSNYMHLQSMLLGTDYEGVEECFRPVMEKPPCATSWTKDDVIMHRELQFTRCFMQKGYAVGSLALGWQGVNITEANREEVFKRCSELTPTPAENAWNMYQKDQYGAYHINYMPFEFMFFKTNRGLIPDYLQQYTEWEVPELADLDAAMQPFLLQNPRGVGCWAG